MIDAPGRIYLQHDPEDEGGPFSEAAEVTWCADKINANDIEYVRADLVPQWVVCELEDIPKSEGTVHVSASVKDMLVIARDVSLMGSKEKPNYKHWRYLRLPVFKE